MATAGGTDDVVAAQNPPLVRHNPPVWVQLTTLGATGLMPQDHVFDPAYRFWHLRRFWQLCLIPPMLGILGATLYPPNATGIATPLGACLILGLWALGSAAYLVLWPRLPLEVLALALCLSVSLAIAPGLALIHPALLGLFLVLWPIAAGFMMIEINRLLGQAIFCGPGVGRHFIARRPSILPPEEIMSALRLGPDQDHPMGRSGPTAPDGSFFIEFPAPPEIQPILRGMADPDKAVWHCRAMIVDESPLHQVQSLIPLAEPQKETRVLLRAEPKGTGSMVFMDEFETDLPFGCAVVFRLIGLHDDYLRARIDWAEGRPSEAIRCAAITSPVLKLAAEIMRERTTKA
jgi:hypothetical protein